MTEAWNCWTVAWKLTFMLKVRCPLIQSKTVGINIVYPASTHTYPQQAYCVQQAHIHTYHMISRIIQLFKAQCPKMTSHFFNDRLKVAPHREQLRCEVLPLILLLYPQTLLFQTHGHTHKSSFMGKKASADTDRHRHWGTLLPVCCWRKLTLWLGVGRIGLMTQQLFNFVQPDGMSVHLCLERRPCWLWWGCGGGRQRWEGAG